MSEPKYRLTDKRTGARIQDYATWEEAAAAAERCRMGHWKNRNEFELVPHAEIKPVRE